MRESYSTSWMERGLNESTYSHFKTFEENIASKINTLKQIPSNWSNIRFEYTVDNLKEQNSLISKSVIIRKMPISNDVLYDSYYIYFELLKLQDEAIKNGSFCFLDGTGQSYYNTLESWAMDSMDLSIKDAVGSVINKNYINSMNIIRYSSDQLSTLNNLVSLSQSKKQLHNAKYGYRLSKVDSMIRELSIQLLIILSSKDLNPDIIAKAEVLLGTLYNNVELRKTDNLNYIPRSVRLEQLYWEEIGELKKITDSITTSYTRVLDSKYSDMIKYINDFGNMHYEDSDTQTYYVNRTKGSLVPSMYADIDNTDLSLNNLIKNISNTKTYLEGYNTLLDTYKQINHSTYKVGSTTNIKSSAEARELYSNNILIPNVIYEFEELVGHYNKIIKSLESILKRTGQDDLIGTYTYLLTQYNSILVKAKRPKSINIDTIYSLLYIRLNIIKILNSPDLDKRLNKHNKSIKSTMQDLIAMIDILINQIPFSSYLNTVKSHKLTNRVLDKIAINGSISTISKNLNHSNELMKSLIVSIRKECLSTDNDQDNSATALNNMIHTILEVSSRRINGDFKEYIETAVDFETLYTELSRELLEIKLRKHKNLIESYVVGNLENSINSGDIELINELDRKELKHSIKLVIGTERNVVTNFMLQIIPNYKLLDSVILPSLSDELLIKKYREKEKREEWQ